MKTSFNIINTNPKIAFKSLGPNYVEYFDARCSYPRNTQNTTELRTKELNYDGLAKIIQQRLSNYDKVYIMPMNCSDGTESYAFAHAIIKNEGYDVFQKKYAPIFSTDVCPQVIEKYGQSHLIRLYDREKFIFDEIDKNILQEVNESDYHLHRSAFDPEKLYRIDSDYAKNFKFGTMNFCDRIDGMESTENAVVSIRNCLAQSYGRNMFHFDLQPTLFKLCNKIKNAGLFISGSYDIKNLPEFKNFLESTFNELQTNVWGFKYYHEPAPVVKKENTWYLKRYFSLLMSRLNDGYNFENK